MWSKLSDELDILDDHTQIASRAGEGARRTTRINMKYRIYSPGGGGEGHQLEWLLRLHDDGPLLE